MFLFWFIVTFVPTLFIISYFVYLHLEKKQVLPEVRHPYTGKKKKVLYFEFTRLLFFLVLTVVSIFGMNLYFVTAGFIFIIIQVLLMKSKIKQELSNRNSIELQLSDGELEEAELYFYSLKDIKKNRVELSKRIVLSGDTLYFSKRRKVHTRDKMYRYIFLSSFEIMGNHLELRYGFLGTPLFKKYVFVPKRQRKQMDRMIKEIKMLREEKSSFLDKYIMRKATERANKWASKKK